MSRQWNEMAQRQQTIDEALAERALHSSHRVKTSSC
jgi:hypothetical protein